MIVERATPCDSRSHALLCAMALRALAVRVGRVESVEVGAYPDKDGVWVVHSKIQIRSQEKR